MDVNPDDEILVLIARHLAGHADQEEENQLRGWISYSETNSRYFEQLRNIWNESDKQINPDKINTSLALYKLLRRLAKQDPLKKLYHYWQKIAAVIILPLAVGAFLLNYLNSQKAEASNYPVFNEVFAMFGTRSAIKLADSTLVWLNSGSSLKYPDKFNKKERKVYLTGEAYFEVKNDVSRPFIVRTSGLQVKATGTKFNVIENASVPVTEVTLVSGKVFVFSSDESKNSQLISELKPNQHLNYNRETREKTVIDEDSYKFIAWKDGKLIFRNEPFGKVITRIGQIFNVDIELRSKELENYSYRATFEDESLDEILKLLKLSSPINYVELKRNPLPDGSFPKKRIIISLADQIKNK